MRKFNTSTAGAVATDYLSDLRAVLARVPAEPLARAIAALLDARARGRRVYVVGNGGSAATASHFVCDLVKTAQVPGVAPFRAYALTDNVALLTAWANDHAYAETFTRQLQGLIDAGDVVVGISASGNSPNIVDALHLGNRLGARTIALLGFDGGAALDVADIAIHVPCGHYGLSEDTHSAICHAIASAIRMALEQEHNLRLLSSLDEAAVGV